MVFDVNRQDFGETRIAEIPAIEVGGRYFGFSPMGTEPVTDGIESTYDDLLEGRADPAAGDVCALHTETLG